MFDIICIKDTCPHT